MEGSVEVEFKPRTMEEAEPEKTKTPMSIISLGLVLLLSGIAWVSGSTVIFIGLVTGSEETIGIFKEDVYMVALFGFLAFLAFFYWLA